MSSARSGALTNFGQAHCEAEHGLLRKVSKTFMTSATHSPKTPHLSFILFIAIVLIFQTTAFARRHSSGSNRRAARAEKGRRVTARERRGSRRDRLNARNSRRGGKQHLSARDTRRERKLIAQEQSSSLKALERRLHRPLNKRERAAELRRIELRHRRDLEAARRRAEAARQAAIARQRALDKALRDEVQALISKDDTSGEDPEVRRVAVNALGNHAGTVVVMDPLTGKVYSIVNQEWALRRGFKPCSTIKLVTGVAGLSEKVIPPAEMALASDRARMDLTSALAHSDNPYFERVGSGLGFDKMVTYARELGLGEKTGLNVGYEYPGRLPEIKPGFALHRMFSYADGFEVTALQLGTLVSAMANGGKVLIPQTPRTAQEQTKFKPRVRRTLDIDNVVWQRMVPGMVGSVNYGSGRRAYDPMQTVAGKTGTCIGEGGWVGLFTSYAPLANPRLAVVVIGRGTDAHHHLPAAVAGQIYRDLNRRFGTPTNLQIATTPDDEEKEVDPDAVDDVQGNTADQQATETVADSGDKTGSDATAGNVKPGKKKTVAATTAAPEPKPLVEPIAPGTVKRVLMPIERRNTDGQQGASGNNASSNGDANQTAPQPDDRPRRAQRNEQ